MFRTREGKFEFLITYKFSLKRVKISKNSFNNYDKWKRRNDKKISELLTVYVRLIDKLHD